MSLLTEQEIKDLLIPLFIRQDQASIHWPDIFEEVALIEAAVIEKIKAQGLVAFEYNGEPWFDGNSWHEQKELTKDRKVAEFKAYIGKPPVPLYRLPEGE